MTKLLWIFVAMIACLQCAKNTEATANNPRAMMCEYLLGSTQFDWHRCENDEVVCYANNDGLSCLKK